MPKIGNGNGNLRKTKDQLYSKYIIRLFVFNFLIVVAENLVIIFQEENTSKSFSRDTTFNQVNVTELINFVSRILSISFKH
jgi:hypothetical protein